jgi:hypothetical protein
VLLKKEIIRNLDCWQFGQAKLIYLQGLELEEIEGDEDEEVEMTQENDVSSEIGTGDGTKMPAAKAFDSAAESDELSAADVDKETASVGEEDENVEKVSDLTENSDEDEEDVTGATPDSAMNENEDADEDDLDIEEIIRELEMQADGEEAEEAPIAAEGEEEAEVADETPAEEPIAEEDEIDLDEILREMGYGDDEEEAPVTENEDEDADDAIAEIAAKEAELEEAYSVIKSLKKTINEVNLLNAKLLYVNKLFRGYNLTNEQKTKVVETLDRTKNVREVKLVYTTIAESFKFGSSVAKKTTTKLTESYASKPAASTAPKQIIAEDNGAARFQKLAGIIK